MHEAAVMFAAFLSVTALLLCVLEYRRAGRR